MKYISKINLFPIIPCLFYWFTLAPTVLSGDSAAWCRTVDHFWLLFGNANDHPLHIIIGKAFSFLPFELAYNINLESAFFGVLTVYFVYKIIRHLSNSLYGAMSGALSLMVSHAFWLHSVIAEVYTLNTFFLSLLIYLSIKRESDLKNLILFLIIFLLGLTNHLILALTLPAFLLFFFLNISPESRKKIIKLFLILAGILIIACLFFYFIYHETLIIRINDYLDKSPPILHYLELPDSLRSFFKELGFYFLYMSYQFPVAGIIIGAFGVYRLFNENPKAAALLMLIMLLNGLFFIKTTSWNSYGGTKYTFYIPDYMIFSIFLGYGSAGMFRYLETFKSFFDKSFIHLKKLTGPGLIAVYISCTVLFYSFMPLIVNTLNLDLLHARTLAYRDNNSYFLNPDKRGYYGDRKLGEEILSLSKKNSYILADSTICEVLYYLQEVENLRSDVRLKYIGIRTSVREWADKAKEESPDTPIYIADNDDSYYDLSDIKDKYLLKSVGPFYELIPPQ